MSKLFKSVQLKRPGRSRFDLSHDVKMSTQMGRLTPTLCMEVVPGDHITLGCDALARLAPMVAPMMHRVDVKTETFFVPNRLLWSNWEDYITGGDSGALTPACPFITLDPSVYGPGTLPDYMGVGWGDPATKVGVPVSALPFAAYQLIFDEYYRDQNLQASDFTSLSDGDNNSQIAVLTQLRNRCWEHDAFTSALPFSQKGPVVGIPIGDVTLKAWDETVNPPLFRKDDGTVTLNTPMEQVTDSGTGKTEIRIGTVDSGAQAYDPNGTLTVASTTINELRTAYSLQRFLERQAVGGTRYTEVIRAHFGVQSKDSRLQRPEFVYGTRTPIVISEVLNTTGTVDAPQGNMAGHGVTAMTGRYGSYYATEHGFLITILSVMPRTGYQEGLPRMFTKIVDKYDHFWPEFAHLGEQEVLQKEVWAGASTGDNLFGYLPRWWEYKSFMNRSAGDFKTTLNFWHMNRIFGSTAPALNADFVEADPTTRVFAVDSPTVDHVWMAIVHKIMAVRPMPYFSTPGW